MKRRSNQRMKQARTAAHPVGLPARPQLDLLREVLTVPAFLQALCSLDKVRSVTLVAKDVASLAVALNLGTSQTAPLWHHAVFTCQGSAIGLNLWPESCILAIKHAVYNDMARNIKMDINAAMTEYHLSVGQLLAVQQRVVDRYPCLLDVLTLAHRKYGSETNMIDYVKSKEEQEMRKEERLQRVQKHIAGKSDQRRLLNLPEVEEYIKQGGDWRPVREVLNGTIAEVQNRTVFGACRSAITAAVVSQGVKAVRLPKEMWWEAVRLLQETGFEAAVAYIIPMMEERRGTAKQSQKRNKPKIQQKQPQQPSPQLKLKNDIEVKKENISAALIQQGVEVVQVSNQVWCNAVQLLLDQGSVVGMQAAVAYLTTKMKQAKKKQMK